MKFNARYERNFQMLSLEEMNTIKKKRVAIIGLGGLGGYVLEQFTRLGIGSLVLCDGDIFQESNLNRQLLATEENMGRKKASVAAKRVSDINSEVQVSACEDFFTAENGIQILENVDVVIDCLDQVQPRLLLEKIATKCNVPLVHGAIAGWYGQVAVSMPGDGILAKIYHGIEKIPNLLGNPSFTPGVVASFEVAEALKIILGRGEILRHQLLLLDLYSLEFNMVNLQ
ncbi:MAG: HesA/MoeB/ThiF family protein [Clostridia bacterium]